ncbi:DUF4261 domain-containing protein [Corynebacterium sp.]|uniref:DUF4261 domain-containing protein n=1 Tax=Corynebacterium sp. TaxID=1720 RepID=UPI0026DC5E2B|nr:DUF4261 domain-containing protein [Corynebacterium sp.]MDO5077151.1 DUF4261 domain-containing protein [Corynebacterium sp.]
MSTAFAVVFQHRFDPAVTAAGVRAQMLKDWPGCDVSIVQERGEHADGQASLASDSSGIYIRPVDSPFTDDVSELCGPSLLWPDGKPFNEAYQAHCIVAVADQTRDERHAAAMLTRVVASLIRISSETIAVYWAGANHLIYPPMFREMAMQRLPEAPLYLWVAFPMWQRSDGRLHASTQGLDRLGLMDLEILDSEKTPRETHEFLVNVADYLVRRGLVIEDGHTVGESEQERIRAVYAKASTDPEKTVIQLTNQKPQGALRYGNRDPLAEHY